MIKLVVFSALIAAAAALSSVVLESLIGRGFGTGISPGLGLGKGLSGPRSYHGSGHVSGGLERDAPILRSGGLEKDAPILRSDSNINPDGSYNWAIETGNGIAAQEDGTVRQVSQNEVALTAKGGFSYTSPEGEKIALQYVADENGFQPSGAHLPVAPEGPPIPAAIVRALEWIAAHPQPEKPIRRF